jgi:hypothetical protein
MTSLPLRRFAFALLAAVLTLALAAAPAPVQAQTPDTTLTPLDDTFIRGGTGNTTQGDNNSLVTRFSYDSDYVRHTYYKFDLSGIADGTNLDEAVLSVYQEAVLSVYQRAEEGETAEPTDAVFGLDDVVWKEETASEDNPPGGSYGAEDTGTLDEITYSEGEGGRLNFDVTGYVKQKLNNGADSVTNKQVQESGDEPVYVSSKEHKTHSAPELRINPERVTIDISGDGGNDPTGWRMLAAPVGDITVGNLAEETLVQGVPNMQYSEYEPNLYDGYDGSSNSYTVPSGSDATPAAGQGFYWYFFEQDEATALENAGLPFSWTPVGTERTSDVTVSVGPTSQIFFMLGNPYRPAYDLSGLNLDKDGDNDGTPDFSNTVQVWDLNKGTDGEYVSIDRDNSASDDQVATGRASSSNATTRATAAASPPS